MQPVELAHLCLAMADGSDDGDVDRNLVEVEGEGAGAESKGGERGGKGAGSAGSEGGVQAGGADKATEGVLAAFELLSIMGAEFCEGNAALAEAAWGRAAELTDWVALAAAQHTCSDRRFLQRLSVNGPACIVKERRRR